MNAILREIQDLDIERFDISKTISTQLDRINVSLYCKGNKLRGKYRNL